MASPILQVEDLTFHYPDGQLALHGVSFDVAEGESVGLVGPNGAGKSTLLLHLNGLLPGRERYEHEHPPGRRALQHGPGHVHGAAPAVRVHRIAVTREHLPEVRRRVGLLFQDPDDQLFCPTVGEDVAFGPLNLGLSKREVRERVGRALASVGLAGFEHRMPHHLSYGERKRVCLAAVLACDPVLLALDEPTANLDPRGRRQFLSILKGLPAAKIIATHDLEMILELCSRVVLLDEGRLRADGPAEEILSDEPLLLAHGLEMPLSLKLRGAEVAGPPKAASAGGDSTPEHEGAL